MIFLFVLGRALRMRRMQDEILDRCNVRLDRAFIGLAFLSMMIRRIASRMFL